MWIRDRLLAIARTTQTTAYASRRSDIARESGDDGWTKAGITKLTRIASKREWEFQHLHILQGVTMVKSARRATTGDGICIGLTYKEDAVIHPKTKACRDLIREIVSELRSHDEPKGIEFTSIK